MQPCYNKKRAMVCVLLNCSFLVEQAIPLAMAGLRNVHNICPSDVLQFLLGLIKYNENCKNKVEFFSVK